jgi:hypothetical protein
MVVIGRVVARDSEAFSDAFISQPLDDIVDYGYRFPSHNHLPISRDDFIRI